MLNQYKNYDQKDVCVVLNDFASALKAFSDGAIKETNN
jgi:hypothetical protein